MLVSLPSNEPPGATITEVFQKFIVEVDLVLSAVWTDGPILCGIGHCALVEDHFCHLWHLSDELPEGCGHPTPLGLGGVAKSRLPFWTLDDSESNSPDRERERVEDREGEQVREREKWKNYIVACTHSYLPSYLNSFTSFTHLCPFSMARSRALFPFWSVLVTSAPFLRRTFTTFR